MKKIENRMITTTENEFQKEFKEISSEYNVHKIEIDGSKIQTWEDYIKIIEKDFQFPTTCIDNIDRYLDWIRDLTWFDDNDAFIILIRNSKQFFINNRKLRDITLGDLQDGVLPFWESEVEKYVVGGKRRLFRVYLIE